MEEDIGDEAIAAATAGAASLTALGEASASGQLTPPGVIPRGTLSSDMIPYHTTAYHIADELRYKHSYV